jgi:hypothetical protein
LYKKNLRSEIILKEKGIFRLEQQNDVWHQS